MKYLKELNELRMLAGIPLQEANFIRKTPQSHAIDVKNAETNAMKNAEFDQRMKEAREDMEELIAQPFTINLPDGMGEYAFLSKNAQKLDKECRQKLYEVEPYASAAVVRKVEDALKKLNSFSTRIYPGRNSGSSIWS